MNHRFVKNWVKKKEKELRGIRLTRIFITELWHKILYFCKFNRNQLRHIIYYYECRRHNNFNNYYFENS